MFKLEFWLQCWNFGSKVVHSFFQAYMVVYSNIPPCHFSLKNPHIFSGFRKQLQTFKHSLHLCWNHQNFLSQTQHCWNFRELLSLVFIPALSSPLASVLIIILHLHCCNNFTLDDWFERIFLLGYKSFNREFTNPSKLTTATGFFFGKLLQAAFDIHFYKTS